MRLKMKALTQQWMHLPPDFPDFPKPEAPVTHRTTGHEHPIHSNFADMNIHETARQSWRIEKCPRVLSHSGRGPFYVVHMYSGRRRAGDFHAWVSQFLQVSHREDIYILSIDTAIHEDLNIHSPRLWTFLTKIARAGRILAMLLGPPCETWSGARFVELLDLTGQRIRGPRPLRMADALWGLEGLTCAELCQISVGNVLLLKGLWIACMVALRRGAVALEHPVMPREDYKPSIWRSALIHLLLRRPGHLFSKVTIEQWRFGAVSPKPTSFLYANVDLAASLEAGTLEGISRPTQQLIGKSATDPSTFNTAQAKEYPCALNKALAHGLLRGLHLFPVPTAIDADPEGVEFANQAISSENGEMKPDYQPV
eukprot:s2448_g4.t1